MCVVKNEADIIEQTLRSAEKWCDHIYVLDNGSSDRTWEKVRSMAGELPAVVPFKQDPRPFEDNIRGQILRHYGSNARRGDWWCILDADEFYIDDPRSFLKRVPRKYNTVWYQAYIYLFTDSDLTAFNIDPSFYADHIPIHDRLRYYVVGQYSEARFLRHKMNSLHSPALRLHPIYPYRIRLKHFMYRSPVQIGLRLSTRQEPMRRGEFLHEKRANWVPGGTIVPGPAQPEDFPQSWEERIALSSNCHFDRGDGNYADMHSWIPPDNPNWIHRVQSRALSYLRKIAPEYSTRSGSNEPHRNAW